MADIELVIKIPEEEYEIIKNCTAPMLWIEKLIKNGTPLPKGHGDLKDISKIDYQSGCFVSSEGEPIPIMHKIATIEMIRDWLPTIIEADKSEKPTGSTTDAPENNVGSIEPTTKDDLGIDCISREQAIRELKESAEHHANDSREEALLHRDRDIIRALPPVPIRPKGHWIGRKKVGFGEWKDVTVLVNLKGCVTDSCECSECGEWLTGSDEYECSARYCPNCGAKMEEVEE